MKPLEASLFKPLDAPLKEALLRSGVVPINDVFLPHWNAEAPIMLFYGSYGSGKSVYIADRWIDKALTAPYFRGYFGRKVYDDVRGTVFKTIVDRIKELYKDHLFSFSEKPNGSMNIICKANGNEMIPFGASNAASLKSIKDPTDFFCEELDQFTFEDFGFIYSRLRTEKVFTQFWGAFNTDRVYQSHWIRKVLFDGDFADTALKVKANFYDNFFLNPEKYEEKLRLIANGNAAVFNSIAHGEWGIVRTGSEFWKQFDETRHVRPVTFDPKNTLHVSVDENVNPYVTQTLWQVDTAARKVRQVHELLCKTPDNNAPKAARKLIEWMQNAGYQDTVFVYGDPSANRRSTVDENSRSFFDKFIETLRAAGYSVQSRVQRSAPEVSLSADFVNAIYESNLYGWSIEIGDQCFGSIEDYLLAVQDKDGKMLKPKVKDKQTGVTYEPGGHISDTKRYFLTTILAAEFAQFKARGRRRGSVAA